VSARVCYIQREDRGAILSRVRLIGRTADETWEAPGGDARAMGNTAASDAATWIADHLSSKLGGKTLDRLCLDLDGAVCTWVPASSTEPGMLRAVIEHEGGGDDTDPFGDAGNGASGRFPDLPNEMGYQALGLAESPSRAKIAALEGRAPVLAVPEVAARAIVDALDEAGVQVESCTTLWQAIAGAWAPRSGSSGSDRVVSENTPLVAAVLCIPGERIVWAWIRAGVPIAAGAFRSRAGSRQAAMNLLLEEGQDESYDPGGHHDPAVPARALGGRLAAEWLAWAAQIGAFPSRVTWIGPMAQHDRSGLDPQDVADALRRAAPEASVDVIDDDDPVGLTLRRLAERLDDEPRTLDNPDARLSGLSNRPGRVHRAMYHWLAILLLIASAAIGAVAFALWQQRGESLERLAAVRANTRVLLEEGAPELAGDPYPTMKLRERLNAERGPAPVAIPPAKPVLRELETLAFVLGTPDYELDNIDISSFAVTITVRVNDTRAYEELQGSLQGIGGTSLIWNSFNPKPDRDKIRVNGTATWAGGGAGGDS
jgi:hypothetical protein